MAYYAFVHSRSGLTRPVFAGEIKASNRGEAFGKVSKTPAVKKIVGTQQTKDLYVLIHEARDQRSAAEMALAVHGPSMSMRGANRNPQPAGQCVAA